MSQEEAGQGARDALTVFSARPANRENNRENLEMSGFGLSLLIYFERQIRRLDANANSLNNITGKDLTTSGRANFEEQGNCKRLSVHFLHASRFRQWRQPRQFYRVMGVLQLLTSLFLAMPLLRIWGIILAGFVFILLGRDSAQPPAMELGGRG
jgi:hypothetical protein